MLFTWQHYYGAYNHTHNVCILYSLRWTCQGNTKITKLFAQVLVAYEWKVRQLALCTQSLHHWMPRVCSTHKTHEWTHRYALLICISTPSRLSYFFVNLQSYIYICHKIKAILRFSVFSNTVSVH